MGPDYKSIIYTTEPVSKVSIKMLATTAESGEPMPVPEIYWEISALVRLKTNKCTLWWLRRKMYLEGIWKVASEEDVFEGIWRNIYLSNLRICVAVASLNMLVAWLWEIRFRVFQLQMPRCDSGWNFSKTRF